MNFSSSSVLTIATALVCLGCERKTVVVEMPPVTPIAEPITQTKTLETSRLGSAVDDYEREPSAKNQGSVKRAFANLDGEIAELEELVAKKSGSERQEAAAKLKNLQAYRTAEAARFAATPAGALLSAPPSADARTGVDKAEDAANRIGNTIEDAARKTGEALRDAVR